MKQVKVSPKNAKQSVAKKSLTPMKAVTPKKAVIPKNAVTPKDVVTPKNAVKPKNAVTPKNGVTPKNAVTPKKAVTPKNAVTPKKVAATALESVEVVKKTNVTKKPKKKVPKVLKKVVEVTEVPEIEGDESEEDQDDVEEDIEDDQVEEDIEDDQEEAGDVEDDEEEVDDEDVMEQEDEEEDEEQEQDEEDEQEEDEEDEQEEDEEDEQEEDGEDEQEEDDDDEPEEAAIDEEPTLPSKVKSGEIAKTVPLEQIVVVKNLPIVCNQVDIVQALAQYGAIYQIHIRTTPTGRLANVAFKTTKAAKAALAANNTVKVKDCLIKVLPKTLSKSEKRQQDQERCICIKRLQPSTTEKQIKEHFKGCGEIEACTVTRVKSGWFGFVTFTDKEAVAEAKKLHNSILNDSNIGVFQSTDEPTITKRDPKLTIIVENKQQLKNIQAKILEKIFAKCGEIATLDVLCTKNILAFISFKNNEGFTKAIELNGKTEKGIELEIRKYDSSNKNKKTSIYVSHLPLACTKEHLENLFSESGEISDIILKNGYAIIHFKDSDAYCKSFLLNESRILNQIIFVEPYSYIKQQIVSKQKNVKKGHKRPAQNGNKVFVAKRAKRD